MKRLAVVSLLGLIASCKQLDNMENMNSKTNELATTSNQISQTSDSIAKQSESILDVSVGLKKNTEDLYHQARSKEAEETRQRARDALKLESSFEEKITRSAIYFKSFEFQLWTNKNASSRDDQEYRKELQLEAAEEFFRTVQSFYAEIGDSTDISPASEDTATRALFSLSVTMHETHHAQKELIKKENIEEISMLSMIEDTLKKESQLNDGLISLGDLKPYEIAILENAESARNLLRMRYDILSSMVLAKVSDLGDPTYGTVASTYTQLKLYMMKWNSKFVSLNPAQKAQVDTFLGEALRMKEVLSSLGINSELESKIGKIYRNMQFTKTTTCKNCVNKNDINNQLQSHKAQIEALLTK